MSTMRKIAAVLIIGSAARFVTDRFHPALEAMFIAGCLLVIVDGILSWRRKSASATSSN